MKSQRRIHISRRFRLAALLAMLIVGTSVVVVAAPVATSPVGIMSLSVPAGTDILVSAPLRRPAVFTGRVAVVDGDRITVEGAPDWAEDALVYAQGVRPETYHAQLGSGAMRGAFFTITANSSASLTLDLNGETLDEVVVGDRLTVRPYWTLGTLFGGASGFPGSSTFTPRAAVQLRDPNVAGTNLPLSHQFFYYSGTLAGGPGWRRTGSPLTARFDDVILYPDTAFRIRNSDTNPGGFFHAGGVPMDGHRVIIGTRVGGVGQDNMVVLQSGAGTTLGNSGLVESGAIAGSATFTPVDSVLVFDNAAAGINKSASAVYFYYTGSLAGGPGWRRQGAALNSIFDGAQLNAQEGFIVRKRATEMPQETAWTHIPHYLAP